MAQLTPVSPADLSELGNVPESYRHEWRVVTPRDPLVLPGSLFKWYQVHREGVPVAADLDAEARAVIAGAMAQTPWDPSYGLNFVVLHVSTTHAFLIAGVWRGHQELWERIYARELSTSGTFIRIPTDGEDTPAGCVWEMAAICHERTAWHRYLFSDRSPDAKHAWLADLYAGPA
jgi:hypothetical protein